MSKNSNNEYWFDIANKILDSISDFAHNASDVIDRMNCSKDSTKDVVDYHTIANNLAREKIKWWKIVVKFIVGAILILSAISMLILETKISFLTFDVLFLLSSLFFIPSPFLLVSAHKDIKLKKIIKEYVPLIGMRPEVSVAYLSTTLNRKKKLVKRDIKKMLRSKVFSDEAYYNKKMDILVLDGYKEEMSKTEKTDNLVAAILDEWINKINLCILEIKNIEIEQKINSLIGYIDKIKEYIIENTESEKKLRTFVNYYLPTTVKLLESYIKIEKLGTYGENTRETKERIEKSLDMLVTAYKNQLETLYLNETIDISGDMDVLEYIIKKDGFDK